MHVWILGVPSNYGGGDVERGHTALVFRKAHFQVSVLHFTHCACGKTPAGPDPENPWIERLQRAGVTFHAGSPGSLGEVPGLAGGNLISFCHPHAIHNWPELHAMGCRLFHSPCMNFVTSEENPVFSKLPPTAVHFQSQYQEGEIRRTYEDWGVDRFARIHGAFADLLPFRPRPHKPGEPFVVGRLARPDRQKWNPFLWKLLGAVREAGVDLMAICQGWSPEVQEKAGEPPEWASCLPPDSMPAEQFLARCHAMVCPNWSVAENWPRVGLEAMASGVPLVTDSLGGWEEMTGGAAMRCQLLGDYPPALIHLSRNEDYRQELIRKGRARAEELMAEPVARQWRDFLG